MMDFTFDVSYGGPQEVRVLARRSLGDVTLHYRVNGGPAERAHQPSGRAANATARQSADTTECCAALCTGTNPGDTSRCGSRAAARGASRSLHGRLRVRRPVLVIAAEDYTGASPDQACRAPLYLSFYTDALAANGVGPRRLRRRRQRPRGA